MAKLVASLLEAPASRFFAVCGIIAVPDRLEEGVGEAEVEDIHDRLFPEEVVNVKDRVFREHRVRDAVELARGGQIATEWLFDDDARVLGHARVTKPLDHCFEE